MNAALAPPLVEQPIVAVLAVCLPLALHIAHAHPGDLGCLDPTQLPRHRFQITSCSFIIRSVSRAGILWLGSTSPDSPARPGPDN
jgi:hypothetical protein